MTQLPVRNPYLVAVVPLVGRQEDEEAAWVGAMLARLLAEHLRGAGLDVLDYNDLASHLAERKVTLPLEETSVQAIRQALRFRALIHGRYVLEEEGKMLGLRLVVEAPDVPAVPLETSSPLAGFGRFVERVALALIEQLRVPIDDGLRQRVASLARPASFEAFRQFVRAQAAWAKGQNELALAAVTSALALDANLEEAAALEVAIARTAQDTATTREAFRRWSAIAEKQGRPLVAAERLLMLGHWLAGRSELDEARRAYEDARSLFQGQKDEYRLALALNDLANIELARGNYQEAIQAYRRTLRALESGEEGEADTASALHNLAVAHKNQGQLVEAERAIEQALNLARQKQDTYLEARCLAQRGAIYDDIGRWARAESDYAQAVRLLDVLGDDLGVAVVNAHQALLFKQQGSYERAEALMLQAVRALERLNAPHEEAIAWLNLGDLYLSMGVYDRAWEHAERARETLTRLNSGWAERAKDLLEALASIPEEPVEEEPPSQPPMPPTQLGTAFPSSSPLVTPPPGESRPFGGQGGYMLPLDDEDDVGLDSAAPADENDLGQ